MQNPSNEFVGIDLLVNKKKSSSDAASIISSISTKSKKRTSKNNDSSSVSSIEIASTKSLPRREKKDGNAGVAGGLGMGKRPSYSSSSSMSSSSMNSSSNSSNSDDSSSIISSISDESSVYKQTMSKEDILNAKKELLYQFDRLERKGVKVPKKFNLASSLEEMKLEYDRIKTDREVESSIKFQRQMLMTCITGIEFMNNKFDPFDVKLDGWSESISENINDYDDIFEELYHKYKGKAKMPPELRLLFAIGGSAVMFHFSNSMMKYGLENAMKQNPELVKQFATATVNSMASGNGPIPQKTGGAGGLFGGLGGILGSLFGGGGGGGNPMASMMSAMAGGGGGMPAASGPSRAPPPAPKGQMRGPSNVDDILRELHQNNDATSMQNDVIDTSDRIEIVSTVSDSELSDIPEAASINGVFTHKKKAPQARRTLNI